MRLAEKNVTSIDFCRIDHMYYRDYALMTHFIEQNKQWIMIQSLK